MSLKATEKTIRFYINTFQGISNIFQQEIQETSFLGVILII